MGSQDVIAAKCCPGHSLAAQKKERRRGRQGVRERINSISQILEYLKSRIILEI